MSLKKVRIAGVMFLFSVFGNALADGFVSTVDLAKGINNVYQPLQSNSNLLQTHNALTSNMSTQLSSSGNATGGNGGNAVGGNVSFSNPHQAPSVFMSAAMPTAPCQAPMGGFLSLFIFGGAGVNGSMTLDECLIAETARMWMNVGDRDTAAEVLCKSKHSESTIRCLKMSAMRKEIEKADAEDAANEGK